MSPGSSTESYPAFARIRLRENPEKHLNQDELITNDNNANNDDPQLNSCVGDKVASKFCWSLIFHRQDYLRSIPKSTGQLTKQQHLRLKKIVYAVPFGRLRLSLGLHMKEFFMHA
ncbi:hypothetical protein ANN_02054 [Periplaneta americana]|uniref:Uncharacterized protein n=1 Tax=Periplaneta americana TaxID=6978 RepID=A0ABQ8TV79_PERAM|nr:hypothetical protein ANN_02054 [Periplaneta americana]